MDFICLDGSTISVDIKPSKYRRGNISQVQDRALAWVEKQYGNQVIIQEFPIPKSSLRIDIFLPNIMVAIEAHGDQHFEFSKHYHKNKAGFRKAKQNDELKAQWCQLNNIELVIWTDSKNGQKQ